MLESLSTLRRAKTSRYSSWDRSGRNADSWRIAAGETRVLGDIKGPGRITHIWMTQGGNYRECLVKITFDNAPAPSVLVPLGDFFGLGHGIVNSYQSLLFSASANTHNVFNGGCALNCYAPMPFRERAVVELVNETDAEHNQYFYVDYETYDSAPGDGMGYFHAEFRRENPFGGWGHEIITNFPECNIVNKERLAWDNNYVILETKGRGHYIGCNISVTNLQGTWWGEGDDMIWVDGYKWPPDLHGTGSEDYLNQAWAMQPNAFLRNGSSIFENHTKVMAKGSSLIPGVHSNAGGYQTSYVHHLENPVHFTKEIKVTIEHGHGNHLRNEMSSVAYWYADRPYAACPIPPLVKRLPILHDEDGNWIIDTKRQTCSREIVLNEEMKSSKAQWKYSHRFEEDFEPVPLSGWEWAGPFNVKTSSAPDLKSVFKPEEALRENGRAFSEQGLWKPCGEMEDGIVNFAKWNGSIKPCICYARLKLESNGDAAVPMGLRLDYFARLWLNGKEIELKRISGLSSDPIRFTANLKDGENEILVKVHSGGLGHAFALNFEKKPDTSHHA